MPEREREHAQDDGVDQDVNPNEDVDPASDVGPASDIAADEDAGPDPDLDQGLVQGQESDLERRRRRALFLRELNEAKALRERVKPRQARAARMRQQMRMRTFRW
ncbi:hypothetical protein [Streptomyces sp. NPDC088725]|uniref:hypothetical protein n=1 Tax=Streptomyces sp. NPDC088725 TaxID=3365873 RepID=UPI0038304DDE